MSFPIFKQCWIQWEFHRENIPAGCLQAKYEVFSFLKMFQPPLKLSSDSLTAVPRQKNAHGKIIIVYDNDERLASQAATTMCERGFENLFMLSGGERAASAWGEGERELGMGNTWVVHSWEGLG